MARRRGADKGGEDEAGVRAAIAAGRKIAVEAIELRSQQRRSGARRHAASMRKSPRRRAPAPTPAIPAKTLAMLGPKPTSGVLLAEGDSWFDYPGQDVLQLLEDDHLFDVESVAHKGDCVEDMAHSSAQFADFARRLEKLLRDKKVPRAILLSGGGNDIAGDEFAILLNHAASALPTLNEDVVRGIIDVRLRAAFASLIAGVTRIAQAYLGRPIPILIHGYGHAVPDGRGFLGGWWFLPGPWLEPGFHKKGHRDLATNKGHVTQLIDRFNDMLRELSTSAEFAHVRYVNLRDLLPNDSTYKKHWVNELHPTKSGFERVAERFAETINAL